MLQRLRRFLDVRPGEGLSVLLTFLYIAVVVASFLLAKADSKRSFPQAIQPLLARLRLRRGSDRADAVRPAVCAGRRPRRAAPADASPRSLSLPSTSSLSGTRSASTHSRCCRASSSSGSTASASSRRCRRGASPTRCSTPDRPSGSSALIGAGASFGAIAGGVLARYLVKPVGGAVNMLLVLAALISAGRGHRHGGQHAHPAEDGDASRDG